MKLSSTLLANSDEDSRMAPSKPAAMKSKPPEAGAPSSDEILETMSAQSGASSNQDDERENPEGAVTGASKENEVLPTLD